MKGNLIEVNSENEKKINKKVWMFLIQWKIKNKNKDFKVKELNKRKSVLKFKWKW